MTNEAQVSKSEKECRRELQLVQDELAYIKAMLDTQQTFMIVLNSHFKIEKANQAFVNFILNGSNNGLDFELPQLLGQYQDYKLPSTNIDLVKILESHDDFKVTFELSHSSFLSETFIFSIRLSKCTINKDRKYIITLNDITVYEKAKVQEIELFKYKEKYHNTQEKNAFQKQLKIIKDDNSHTCHDDWFFDSFYKPLDILSGDAYGTIRVDKDLFFFYIVDAMGKGLAASVTSIQSSSFINNSLYQAINKKDFSFQTFLSSFTSFIRKQLLSDEMLCATFMLLDTKSSKMEYANYAMPPITIVDKNDSIVCLETNNPPIMSYFNSQNIDSADVSSVQKMIIFSDGLNENMTKTSMLYQTYLEEDLTQSGSLRSFLEKINEKTSDFEDDLTIIYIANHTFGGEVDFDYTCKSKSFEIALALQTLEGYVDLLEISEKEKSGFLMAINEIVTNCFEHGNLNIDGEHKDKMLREGSYDEYFESLELDPSISEKTISIKSSFGKKNQNGSYLMQLVIEDEGNGFDVSEAFKHLHIEDLAAFRGRGIPMSIEFTDGLFYDNGGSKAVMLKEIAHK